VVQAWARTLNHRPRPDRGDRSRVEEYREDVPTPEEVETARTSLAERLRQQEAARETRRARLDPQVRELLDETFERLGLLDPERRVRDAIAIFPLDPILAGIAIYETRAHRGTLPEGVDARYLLGIVRDLAHEDEGVAIAENLLRLRIRVRDATLRELEEAHAQLRSDASDPLDRHFWISATADLIRAQPTPDHAPLFRIAARRIHSTHRVPHRARLAATRRLAARVSPIR